MLAIVVKEPIGVVSMITPWNFPLLIISQKLPLALAVGCTAVVKPSEFTSGTTLKLGGILKEAGLPDGVVNILSGYGDPVGIAMTNRPVEQVNWTEANNYCAQLTARERSAGRLPAGYMYRLPTESAIFWYLSQSV